MSREVKKVGILYKEGQDVYKKCVDNFTTFLSLILILDVPIFLSTLEWFKVFNKLEYTRIAAVLAHCIVFSGLMYRMKQKALSDKDYVPNGKLHNGFNPLHENYFFTNICVKQIPIAMLLIFVMQSGWYYVPYMALCVFLCYCFSVRVEELGKLIKQWKIQSNYKTVEIEKA